MGECSSERKQLVRLGPSGNADTLDLSGKESVLERELGGDDRPLYTGLDLHRLEFDRGDGCGESQILGRIVPRLESEESDEIAEPLDEGGLGVQVATSRHRLTAKCIGRINFATPDDQSRHCHTVLVRARKRPCSSTHAPREATPESAARVRALDSRMT